MTNLPPGPSLGLQQFLNLRDPLAGVAELARQYGDPMTLPMIGAAPMVLTWGPTGIKTLFTEDPDTFVGAMPEGAVVLTGKDSVMMLSGAAHKRARKMLMPPFHGERMRLYGTIMRDAALRWTAPLEVGKPFQILETLQCIALDVIIEAVFGVRGSDRMRKFHEQIVTSVASFNPAIMVFKALRHEFMGLGPWARFQREYNAIRTMVFEEIEAHRASPEGREDVLSLLVAARDEQGEGFDNQEILDQLFTIVLAGHATTAATLAWSIDLLHRHPEVLARLREELAPLGTGFDPTALERLPYLDAVVQETLRLYPSAAVATRKLRRPLTLNGFELPEGTVVGALISLAHRREEVFPEPAAFRPERFLGRSYSPFEFLPYGGGMRRCLGAAFATYQMRIVLATLLTHYDLKLCDAQPPRHVVRTAFYAPDSGVPVVIASKRAAAAA